MRPVTALRVLLGLTALSLRSPALAQPAPASAAPRMKAIVHREWGPPDLLRLEEVDRPALADDRVLVRVRAAAVNPLDLYMTTGKPYLVRMDAGLLRPASERLGVDLAGVVEAVGRNVTRFKPGDEVFGHRWGAFGEYVDAKEISLASKPANVTFEQAAGVAVAGITALQALRDRGKVKPGQKVLVSGASGGVGTFAVQIAKALGAEVTGVCSTRNVELVRSLGADRVIDYTKEDFTRRGERYDVIVDMVRTHPLADTRRALEPRGVYVLVGAVDKGLWLKPLHGFIQAALLRRFVTQELTGVLAKVNAQDLDALRDLMQAGKLTPVIDRRYRLGELPEALRYLETGRARGKVVVTVDPAGEHAAPASSPGSGDGTWAALLGVAAAVLGVPLLLALALNRRFQRGSPGKRPYRWGYYLALLAVLQGAALGVGLELGPAVLAGCIALYGLLAWGFARRRRGAWIALTLLTFNPLVWIVNLVYLSRRWREDAPPVLAI